MSGLDSLLGAINQFTGVSENQPGTLNTSLGEFVINYGKLGDFSSKIDQSAQRSYVEDGFIRSVRPRQSEILMQEPDVTVIIKKRMFSSLIENYKPELMDAKEKLFYRASKKLFENKCKAISAYESLTKIDRIIQNSGAMNNYMVPVVTNALDILTGAGLSLVDGKTMAMLNTIQKVQTLSDPNYRTTWITEKEIPAVSDLGEGTGTFEITNISSIQTTSSVEFGGGSASFTLEDPYRMTIVTTRDIEKAIQESYSGFLNNAFFRITEAQLQTTVDDLRRQLDSARKERGASAIRFFINEDSLLFKKLRAVIDEEAREISFEYDGGLAGLGSSVDVAQSALDGFNGLSTKNISVPIDGFDNVKTTVNELDCFKQLVSNIYLLMGMQKSTTTNNFQFNRDTNYVRRKMKLHFGGKAIIQPMDVVHVFKSTKSLIDAKSATVVNDNMVGNEIATGLNNTIAAIDELEASLNGNDGGEGYAVQEKNAIAGPDFPMWLWNMMRNDFTRQGAGTHTWAGIVDHADPSMPQPGKFVLNVSCKDNCAYFEQGQININPSVEVHNSRLYDPLTPFDLDFDLSSGFLNGEDGQADLLQENKLLLNSGLIRFKNGRFRGYPASEQIYQSFDVEKIKNSSSRFSVRRKYEDPDGFTYRWKEGIQSHTLLGEPHPSGQLPGDAAPLLTKDPFAGQDVMNVLSLLITGLPYNFNTFMRSAIATGGFSRDDLLNENNSASFLRGLLSDISKNNATWGNFIPFKKMIINRAAYAFLRSGELDLVTANKQIQEKLRERAARFDQLTTIAPAFANNPQYLNVDENGRLTSANDLVNSVVTGLGSRLISDTGGIKKLTSDILSLDFEIEQIRDQFQSTITNSNLNTSSGALQIVGDDISYDPDIAKSSGALTDADRERLEFRKKINNLTQRRLWKVKANEDSNLFIVDDSYDKNYDIQAFEQSLAGSLELFKSSYMTIGEKVRAVSSLLGLEIFSDSQGHIQARPPQYNRMPSSIFYKMVETKNLTGVQIFPPYLESLFTNQVKGLSEKVEILEDEIRLRAAVIGYPSDDAAKKILSGYVSGGGVTSFGFVTDELQGKFGGKDIRVLFAQVDPDLIGEEANQTLQSIGTELNSLQSITGQALANVNFDIAQRINLVTQTKFVTNSAAEIEQRVADISARLERRSGNPAPSVEVKINENGARSQVDILSITNQIAQLISQRQSALKLLSNSMKNLQEGISVNTSKEAGESLLLPFLNKEKAFPEILEHMIEDESYDDIGFNSGKRYIIRDNQIISMSLRERAPEYTAVEVNGLFDPFIGNQDIGFDTGGGNPISTAWAVDYDLWRMYGLKMAPPIQAPMLSNPDTQCAPFATYLLNKARANIFQASIEIAGNEFIQPGEVYYIDSLDLLFYAEKVTHNFTFGQSFTTTLELTYGHNPGEYIPTILDIIGKGLYTTKNQADLSRHNRHGNSNGDIHISTVVYDINAGGEPLQNLVGGSYGDANRRAMSNVLLAASGALTPNNTGRQGRIELRTYISSEKGFDFSETADAAQAIKDWVMNPTQMNLASEGDLLPDNSVDEINNIQVSDASIQSVKIDVSEIDEPRSPSAGAMNKARELAGTIGVGTPSTDDSSTNQDIDLLTQMLTSRIVDIWLVFDSVPVTNEITNATANELSSSAQTSFQKALADFNSQVDSKIGQ
jgi:hypothetical protein